MIKIGINGFGRIGRFVFRSTVEAENAKEVQVVSGCSEHRRYTEASLQYPGFPCSKRRAVQVQ